MADGQEIWLSEMVLLGKQPLFPVKSQFQIDFRIVMLTLPCLAQFLCLRRLQAKREKSDFLLFCRDCCPIFLGVSPTPPPSCKIHSPNMNIMSSATVLGMMAHSMI